MPKIIGRLEAARAGLKRYYTGEACPHGHVAERFVMSTTCVECNRARSTASMRKHRAKLKKLIAAAAR